MRIPRHSPVRRAPLRLHPLAACLASALLAQAGLLGAATPTLHGGTSVQNCDDSGAGSLRDAIASAATGDVIDFSGLTCPDITLTSGAIVIGAGIANLTLVGPGRDALAISGNDSSRVFEQQGAGSLSLSGVTLSQGRGPGNGGCLLANGDLTLNDVTVSGCAAGSPDIAGTSGGGIAVLGNAILTDSHFSDNVVDGNLRVRGGALAVGGTLSATDSTFTKNRAHSHVVDGGNTFGNIVEGGGIQAFGETTLVGSTVSGNTAQSDSYEIFGGGLSVGSREYGMPEAALDVSHSVISDNVVASACEVCAPQGGGIAVVGNTRLDHVMLTNNTVGSPNHYGGAGGMRVFRATSTQILDSTIAGNHADSAGGGMIGPEQSLVIVDGSRIADNFAGNLGGTDEGGGGILCLGCAVQLTSSSVSGNVAESDGGGIAIRYGEYAPSPTTIINSTISGNTGSEGGGLMLDGGNAQVSNSTIAFNLATTRGAGISASQYSYQIELQSTIVSDNLTGGSPGNVWAFPKTISGANNLVPNPSGPGELPGDTITQDPLLLPLADNGGPTLTHALGENSPALDAGNNVLGLVFDQRRANFMREYGAATDIGAFEEQPATDVIFQNGFED